MISTGKRHSLRAIGVLVTLIVLAREASGAPPTLEAPRTLRTAPTTEAPPECGSPEISWAPAMVPCDNGGAGASSCETKQTVSVSGFGFVSGCGISCNDGYYACCQDASLGQHASCSCNLNPPSRPWSPESPW